MLALLFVAQSVLAQVAINPVQLDLTPQASSGLLALTNNSGAALRFAVSAKAWTQGPNGDMQLEDTRDITFYPAIFELPAGAVKRIRVGAVVPIVRGERTYRIFVEQLPSFDGAHVGIEVLTRLSIPIYLGEKAAPALPVIANVRIDHGTLAFSVRNNGEAHFRIKEVRISGRDVGGDAAFSKYETGWYVLGAGTRDYAVELEDCTRLTSAELVVETDTVTVRSRVPIVASACDP
ncbi:MAG: molecular chaperone [Clostridia bacterium]|nr:molecular chaperone [Deltaproteobacteria bacterium]